MMPSIWTWRQGRGQFFGLPTFGFIGNGISPLICVGWASVGLVTTRKLEFRLCRREVPLRMKGSKR